MLDEKFRKSLAEMLEELEIAEEDQPLLLTNHSYDKSIIGFTSEDGRAVYSYESMIQEYMEDEDCSEEEAQEWVDFNTMRALPYGDKGHNPIVITISKEEIEEKY
jgi:hypothetical protein